MHCRSRFRGTQVEFALERLVQGHTDGSVRRSCTHFEDVIQGSVRIGDLQLFVRCSQVDLECTTCGSLRDRSETDV